jgi:threonine dehydrogenase-like Zn-dependent dehydrogenase
VTDSVRAAVLVGPGRYENVGVIAEITPTAAERTEFYGRRLAVGDRVTMCPNVVCGRCYECTRVMGYVWCENSECYGNSFSSAEPPHLLGGMAPPFRRRRYTPPHRTRTSRPRS